MKQFLLNPSLTLLLTVTGFAQSYESGGRSTGRRESSWSTISQVMGAGEDWLKYPTFDMSYNTEFQYSYQDFRSGGSSSNFMNTSDLTTTFRFAPRLAIYSDLTLEQINGPNPGQNSWLGGEGVSSSSLFLQYSNQVVTLGGGQFTPDFGIANALAPGIFGGDFVSDYSFDDQVGLFGGLQFGHEQVGEHVINASVFALDRTALSNSLFTSTGQTNASSGGPGNTGTLDSLSLSYNGIDVPIFSMPILQYQLGMISQAQAEDGSGRQLGYVAGMAVTIPFNRDALDTAASRYTALQPLIEYAHFDNWTGAEDATADFLTMGLEYFYGDWDINVSSTLRDTSGVPEQANEDDYLVQATVGYQLYGYQTYGGNGQISAGWSYSKNQGEDSNMFAVQLSLGWDILSRFQLLEGW